MKIATEKHHMIRFFSGPSLVESLNGHRNALNALRLLLATTVILSHVAQFTDYDLGINVPILGTWCVAAFFVISGYLITASANSNLKNLKRYFLNRFLRIYPACWMALLITAFIFAPIVGALGGYSYGLIDQILYVLKNGLAFKVVPTIGDTTSWSAINNWNPNLWTLLYEVVAYIITPFVLLFLLKLFSTRNKRLVAVLLIELFIVASFLANGEFVHLPAAIRSAQILAMYYLAGMIFWLIRDSVPVSYVAVGLMLPVSVFAIVTTNFVLGVFVLPYVLLALASILNFGLFQVNDISYGVYIYGAPTQFFLWFLIQNLNLTVNGWEYAFACVFVAYVLGTISWFGLEKPLMLLKQRI